MPLHSDDRALFERCLRQHEQNLPTSPGDVLAFYDALAGYHDGDDGLVARALALILSPAFASSRRAEAALERFIRDFERPAVVRAASSTLTSRWRSIAGVSPLDGVSARRAHRLARTYDVAPASDRFTWAWLARPDGLRVCAEIVSSADLDLDTLDPILPSLLSGQLDPDEVALIESLLLHASWVARRVLLTMITGPEHTPLLPALALASSSADPTTTLALVGALRRIGHPAAEHALVTILLEPDPGPDLAILEAMAELATTTYLEALRDFAAADGVDARTRAAAAATVDAIVERASLGGGALTLVTDDGLSGALSASGSASAGALSAPGEDDGGRARAPRGAAAQERRQRPDPAPVDPFHALVRRRVEEGSALTAASPQQLVESSWLSLAPAPRRVPRFLVMLDSPLLTVAAGGLGVVLLAGAIIHHAIFIMTIVFGSPYIVFALIARWTELVSKPILHSRLLRRGLPTLAQISHYDHDRGRYAVSLVTDDNRRVEAFVDAVEGDSRLRHGIQPALYDPKGHDVELFALIEGVEIAPDGQLAPRPSAVFYRNISLALLCAGVLAMLLSFL